MTATRRTPSRSGAKKKPAAKASAKRPPAKKASTTTRGRRAAPVAPPSLVTRVLDALAEASRGHGADFAGLFLAVVGLVAGLGIYAKAGGPVGRGVGDLMGMLFGAARVLAPPLFFAVGVALVRGAPLPAEPGADDPTVVAAETPPAHLGARFALGGVLVSIAGLGLLHLYRGAPGFGAEGHAVADAAGYVGVLIGAPIHSLLGNVGATLLLAAVAVAGILVITRTTIRTVVGRTAAGVARRRADEATARTEGRSPRTRSSRRRLRY